MQKLRVSPVSTGLTKTRTGPDRTTDLESKTRTILLIHGPDYLQLSEDVIDQKYTGKHVLCLY